MEFALDWSQCAGVAWVFNCIANVYFIIVGLCVEPGVRLRRVTEP